MGDFLLAIDYGQQPSRFVSVCSSKTQNETVRVAADEFITNYDRCMAMDDKKMMRNILAPILIITMLTFSGCAVVAIWGAFVVTRKILSSPGRLSEEEKRRTQYRELKGEKEEVLYLAKQALIDWGFKVEEINSDKAEKAEQKNGLTTNITFGKKDEKKKGSKQDMVTGVVEEPLLRMTAVIEKTGSDYVGLRLIAENENGLVENESLYSQIFAQIQDSLKAKRGEK